MITDTVGNTHYIARGISRTGAIFYAMKYGKVIFNTCFLAVSHEFLFLPLFFSFSSLIEPRIHMFDLYRIFSRRYFEYFYAID